MTKLCTKTNKDRIFPEINALILPSVTRARWINCFVVGKDFSGSTEVTFDPKAPSSTKKMSQWVSD